MNFKFVTLTFQKEESEIKKHIKNTIILKHFFDKNKSVTKLESMIEGTQYGYNASALESGKNKFLRISDITDGKVDWDSVPYCDCDDEETYFLYPSDILIARTGGTTGKSFMINNPPKHSIYAGYLIRIRANNENDANFISLFLNSYVYWSQIVSLNEGEFRPSANANTLKNLLLPKCTITQQQDAIKLSNSIYVKGYEQLQNRIEKALIQYENCKQIEIENTAQTQLLSQLRQSILREAIQGKLTAEWREQNPNTEPAIELLKRIKTEKACGQTRGKKKKEKPLPSISEREIPFELPEGWVWCRLGDICLKTGSGSTPRGGKSVYLSNGVKFIRSQNVYNEGLFIQDVVYISKFIHKAMSGTAVLPNDLLLNITGGSIGRCCIVPSNFDEGNINQHVAIVRLFPDLKNSFFHKVICSNYFQSKIIYAQTGAGRGGLPKNKMDMIVCPLPPITEQQAIVDIIETLLSKCYQLQEEIKNQSRFNRNLLKSLFNKTFNSNTL